MKELCKFGGHISPKTEMIVGIIGGTFLILVWYLITVSGLIPEKILPNPIGVIGCIPSLITENDLFGNMWYTIRLNLTGYLYALTIAIPFAFIIGIYPFMSAALKKPIDAMRFTPMPSTTAIFIAIFGLQTTMKSFFLCVSILIYILPAITQKVTELQNPNSQSNIYLQTAITIGMNNWQKFKYVYFPFVMSHSYKDIVNLTAISYTYVVIAECINRDGGLGSLIALMSRQSHMPKVYALLFIIIIIGLIQDYLLKKLEPVLFKYKK